MARIRSVHPSLFTDEAWVSCSPLARILYIGLWTDADDQGLFEWRALSLKMRLLPGDMIDAAALLDELSGVGLIAEFEHAGRPFGAIKDFRKYQRPKKPNAVHFLPASLVDYVGLSPIETASTDASSPPVPHQFPTDGENAPQMEDGGWREGVDEEAKASPSPPKRSVAVRGTRLPDDWTPSPECQAFAQTEGLTQQETARAAAEFRDYWIGRSGRDATKLDWPATWRNWIRRSADRKRGPVKAGGTGPRRNGSQPSSMAGILAERRRQAEGANDVSSDGRVLRAC